MRRLITTFLLLVTFLGGYYLGRQPESPDIFAWARGACHQVDQTTQEIVDKAEAEDTSLPEAVISYALDSGR